MICVCGSLVRFSVAGVESDEGDGAVIEAVVAAVVEGVCGPVRRGNWELRVGNFAVPKFAPAAEYPPPGPAKFS